MRNEQPQSNQESSGNDIKVDDEEKCIEIY